ncbi:unnamed protein product, partial [Polarella glacialis]
EGEGQEKVFDTSKVGVEVLSVSANGEKVLAEKLDLEFVVGSGEVCDALEGSVVGLRRGDEVMLRVERPEACVDDVLGIPPRLEPPIMVHVRIKTVEKVKEKWDLSPSERIQR